ncbi:MAG TPA: hypothetical protein IAB23_12875 [Candidatus Scybalocola faecavium]|nr:hypothetical protein [Candidatus Scybalocola faecavium]
MTDTEVVESFNNAWRALYKQYRKSPSGEIQGALNMIGRIIGKVESEVKESHREHQITIDEWIAMLDDAG